MVRGLGQKAGFLLGAFAAASLLVLPLTGLLWRTESRRFEEHRRAEVLSQLADARMALQAALAVRLGFLHALASYAASTPDVTDEQFGIFAAGLTRGASGVRSLQLARHGVVSHVYPRAGNAGILGLDLRRDLPEGQRQALRRVLKTGQPDLIGPLDLLQGGRGFLARLPVHPAGEPRVPGTLWGLATLVLDADAFFQDVNLTQHGEIQVAIRKAGRPERSGGGMVFGDAALFDAHPVTASLAVPGGVWVLAATPAKGWTGAPAPVGLIIASGGTWLALVLAFFGFLSWPARLSTAVARATAALDAANADLERTVAARTTALTEANAALRREETRYLAFIDATSDLAFLKDAGFRYLVVNVGLAAFFGKTPQEVVGRTDFELMPAVLAARWHESDVATRDGGQVTTFLETLDDRTFEVRKFPVPLGETGLGVGGSMRDISERLAAEQALRQSEEALRDLHDHAPVGIFTSTPAGRYTKANDYLARMYGYPNAAAMYSLVGDIQGQMYFDPDERDGMLDLLRSRDHLVNYETRRLTRSGAVIWVSLNIRAVRDEAGGIVRLEGFCTDITRRKETEAMLARQERELRVIFDNSPLGLVFFDEKGVVVNCNKRLSQLLGLASDRIVGHDAADCLPAFARPALLRARGGTPALAEGGAEATENGGSLYARIMFNPVETGRSPSSVIATVEDTGPLRERDASLRLLWAAVEQSPASIVITDRDGDIEYVNPHFSILTGYTSAEALGSNPRILKSDAHPATFYADMWETLAAGRIWRGELCNRKKNGEIYWENSSISPVRDDSGAITHYVAVKEDITAQKEREQRLRQLMHEFEAIFNASAVGIVHLGADERVVRANRRFGELLGVDPEVLAGRPLDEVHGRVGRLETLRRQLLDKVAAGQEAQAEERLYTVADQAFWCSIHGRRVDPVNAAAGSIWIFDDISARKELEKVREDVERIMRHDLKAPLNSIVNLPEIIGAIGPVNDEQREMLDEIERAGHVMLEQIELSLDLYKMETGVYVPSLQRIDLGHIVSGVADMLAGTARARGVTLDVAVAGSVFAMGNALLCQSVTANLLKNAIEAESSGSVVTVRVTGEDDRGVLSIANPTPVPADIVPVFFEKYTTSGKAGGNGLGTYSARLMILSQHGDIRLDTSPEAGTTVHVSLPTVPTA